MSFNKFLIDGEELPLDWDQNDVNNTSIDYEDENLDENFNIADEANNREKFEFEERESSSKVTETDCPVAPAMPAEFYEGLDTFLSRPPPKFGAIINKTDKNYKVASLPKLKQERDELQKKLRMNPNGTKANKLAKADTKTSSKENKRNFDPNLIEEAIKYTEQLVKENLIMQNESLENDVRYGRLSRPDNLEENNGEENIAPRRRATSIDRFVSKRRSSKDKNSQRSGGLVRKLRNETKVYSQLEQPPAFSTSMEPNEDLRKAPLDFDALVQNFEQGLTLKRLKMELEESKKSMERSEEMMRKMSVEMSMGR